MAFKNVFKRYELKYLLTQKQKERILNTMSLYMMPDKFGKTTIRNLYFDTDSYLLIRRSIEKPIYKEKMRIRSYSKADADSTVFVELKRKYKSLVYKRRVAMQYDEALKWLLGEKHTEQKLQIINEIDYFLGCYSSLKPSIFLSYDREAYFCKENSDLRITFDSNILCRQENLSLKSDIYGTPLLEEDKVLMEIKCAGGIPLWLSEVLSFEKIYKTSFSKYGIGYKTIIFKQMHTTNKYNMMEVNNNGRHI